MKRIFLFGIPIVAVWLATFGWLGVREGWWLEELEMTDMTARAQGTSTSRLRVLLGGEAVGTIDLDRRMTESGGLRTSVRARLVVPLLDFDTPVDLDMTFTRPPQGNDGTTITVSVRAGEQSIELEGRLTAGMLRGSVSTGGETLPLEIPVDQDLLVAGGLGPLINIPPLDTGERVRLTAIDPVTLGSTLIRLRGLGYERLTVSGQQIAARVIGVEGRTVTGRVWLDEAGELIRAETPFGLTLERIENADPSALSDQANEDPE